MSEQHPWIILFDIDGTLLTVNSNFSRPMLREILNELEIDYPQMEQDTFSGRTDHDIFTSFLVNHNYDQQLYYALKQRYLKCLKTRLKESHVSRHNNVDETIRFFSGTEYVKGLLTGNYPAAAALKLKAANIDYNFSVEAFGEHDRDRNRLPYLAVDQVKQEMGINPDPSRFIVIGDTPRDIICGKKAGMKVVSVTTGKFDAEELAKHQPDVIIDSLAKPEQWFPRISG